MRVERGARTRACRDGHGAQSLGAKGGAGEPRGQPGTGHGPTGNSPGFQLLLPPPSSAPTGVFKDRDPGGPRGRRRRGRAGVAPLGWRGGRARRVPQLRSWTLGAGAAREHFVLALSAGLPRPPMERRRRGLSGEGGADVLKQSLGSLLAAGEPQGTQRSEFCHRGALVSFPTFPFLTGCLWASFGSWEITTYSVVSRSCVFLLRPG